MKILVTGGAGFIGSHLCEALALAGHTVFAIDSFDPYYSRTDKERNIEKFKELGIVLHEIDLATDDLLHEIFTDIDVVYHLAAQPGIASHVPFFNYKRNNIIATAYLLDLILKNSPDAFFVNIATSSVYGYFAIGDESVPPAPTSFYGVTKLAAEQLVLSYQRAGKLHACSIRPFSVYGERERPEKLFRKLIHAIIHDEEFTLYEGSLSHKRSFTYVGDIVIGLMCIIDNREKADGAIINFGTSEVYTTEEAIQITEELLGKKARIIITGRVPGDQSETKAVIKRAEEVLGFKPTTSFREGIRRQIDWQKRIKKNI